MAPFAPSEAVVVMDRFVSASSSQDAVESLRTMVDGFKHAGRHSSAENALFWEPSWILDHDDMPSNLIWLLQHGTLKGSEIPCEEGINLACQLFQNLAKRPEALLRPSPGLLLESLLDLLDHSDHPIYVRVLALKVLEELSKRHKSVAGTQWLRAPNGLHRLADLLAIDVEANPMEEAIRNQALIVAKLLAHEAAMAKVFLFAEVECKLLDLCWSQGGLTKGNPIVIDALELIQELLRHADAGLQDLVWQRPNVAPRLAQLLDLRGGEEFLHPTAKQSNSATLLAKLGGDDDLETLLASGETKKGLHSATDRKEELYVPRLLQSEEHLVKLVLTILRSLLETESLKAVVWKQHVGLCSLVWELALINPSRPPVCALPTPSLQQRALDLVADKFNDPVTMIRHSGLDRLLYLVCTGGGIAGQFDEKLGLSQSALAVLRHALSGEAIHDILIRTLAPPPTEDDDSSPPGPTVVQKLWNTVQENLASPSSETRTLFLCGALGGLGLMLFDNESREMMFQVTHVNMDQFLESSLNETEEFVRCSLLRFLCEWIYQCPFLAHKLLNSHSSTHLAGTAKSLTSNQPLVHLLLGLAMESLTKEEECGGWSRSGILQIITKIGISKFTSSLESLKTNQNPKMPWVVSEMELKSWKEFCSQAVLGIRKQVVQELASGSGNEDGDGDSEAEGAHSQTTSAPGSAQAVKPLQRMISQQAREMDELRLELEISLAKVVSQEHQLVTWKRRVESTPTQLDDMLNEFTAKTSELEDTVHSLKAELKQITAAKDAETENYQAVLAESKRAVDRLEIEKQEARAELERSEQEMQALSQAYASLEEDYQRILPTFAVGAPTGEASQQQGEPSRQQNVTGSTEVATLRAENTRLRNDARAADEWMAMAVQRMNEMGAANGELEQQVANMNGEMLMLTSQLADARATAQSVSLEKERASQSKLRMLELELGEEKLTREKVERELSELRNAQMDLQNEQQKSAQLETRLVEAVGEVSDLRNVTADLRMEQTRLSERLADAEEEIRVSTELLIEERNAKHELEKRLEGLNLEIHQHKARESKTDVSTNDSGASLQVYQLQSEISALSVALKSAQERESTTSDTITSIKPDADRYALEEARQKSEQDIYRLESVIRELEDRLGSGLGEYKIEDIRARDLEIEELRKANESAQDWMAKAVEHHQILSSQVSMLSKEKISLTLQLDVLRGKLPREDINGNDSDDLRKELHEKEEEVHVLQRNLELLESEVEELKREKNENQGFLDELGIAMDDVGVMQEKLIESENAIRELEAKLAGNALNAEHEALKASNEDLEKKIGDFQTWTEIAQTRIAEIIASRDSYEMLHRETQLKLEDVEKETETLKLKLSEALKANDESRDNKIVLELLKEETETLKCANEKLQNETSVKEEEYRLLVSRFNALMESSDQLQKELAEIRSARTRLEDTLDAERVLSRDRSIENDALTNKLEETMTQIEALKTQEAEITQGAVVYGGGDEGLDSLHDGSAPRVRVAELLEKLRLKENALSEANSALSQADDVLQTWEDRVSELECELELVQKQLIEQEKEANDAINLWQDSFTSSEDKCIELEEKLKKSIASLAEMRDELDTLRSKTAVLEDENAEFKVRSAGQQTSSSDSSELLNGPEGGHRQGNAAEFAELQNAVEASREMLSRQKESDRMWEERCRELEANVEYLKGRLNKHEEDATELADNWQERCATAEEKCTKLQQELEIVTESKETLEVSTNRDQHSSRQFEAMLQEKDEEIQRALQNLERSQSAEALLKEQVVHLEDEMKSNQQRLRQQEEVWNGEISAYMEKIRILEKHEENANATAEELSHLLSQLEENIVVRQHCEEQVSTLLSQVKALTTQLEQQEAEANRAIQVWEEQVSEAEEENNMLLIELEKARSNETELYELRSVLLCGEEKFKNLKDEADALSAMIVSLEKQLEEQTHETVKSLAHSQQRFSALEAKCCNMETELAFSRGTIASRDWAIEQLKSGNEHYHVQIEELIANSHVKDSLEADVVSATAEISRLTEALESERQTRVDEREQLRAELAGERGRHAEARDEIETLSSSLEEKKMESYEAQIQWTVRYQELDESLRVVQQQLSDAQQQLLEQANEANEAISVWELKTEELENGLDRAESELSCLRDILGVGDDHEHTGLAEVAELLMQEFSGLKSKSLDMQTSLRTKSEQLKNLEVAVSNHKRQVTELDDKVVYLQSQCQDYHESEEKLRAELTLMIGKIEHLSSCEEELKSIKIERDRMRHDLESKSTEKLEEERDRLELVITQLEAEVRDATEMIQAICTNGTTDKATEVAARALLEEIDELKNQLNESWQKFEHEKASRVVAELEIGRLREDIAALVSVSDQENTPTELKKLTSKAIEKLQNRERNEIDEMRKSLFRALEELEASRAMEKEANEKLSKLRLQLSVYDQEIMAAKSEINFLTQAMEELRETEENKRASMEYRIGMLGSENDVVRKYHAAELESARNELVQISMEKDRVLHQLKESEKTNASLVFAASKGDGMTKECGSDLESECTKLRVENAHLLTMAADDKARAERRIREILAVQSAKMEVDVILEHELRLSAEAALATLRLELDEMRNDMAMVRGRSDNLGTGTRNQHDLHELELLMDSCETLRRENASLKNKATEVAAEAKSKVEMLTEECHALRAKIHKMDREGRDEVAVQSEIARMKWSNFASRQGQYSSEVEWAPSVTAVSHEISLTTAEAFDLVVKQKQEIEEERKRHREDISEYEDLFALVAQQDLEKKCLKESLIELAGIEAARDAVRNAEEMAAMNYGTVVRVNG